jgi:hypothetical protein
MFIHIPLPWNHILRGGQPSFSTLSGGVSSVIDEDRQYIFHVTFLSMPTRWAKSSV